MRNPYKVENDDCYFLVSTKYKFVLAFENSICKDYVTGIFVVFLLQIKNTNNNPIVTEKLYNHLKLNVVPVVLGAANYSNIAPPNSFIDASKYSPKELGNYLKILDKNDTLYNEYFEWKKDYWIVSHDG
jgi:hypothetical protein